MATKITRLTVEERLLCIGAGNADASDGILYKNAEDNRAALSGEQRVLIIGLGGQGIKSVNKIKNEVQSKFQDTEGKIAFAALDTDASDLKNYTALSDSEKFVIRSGTGINARYNQESQRSDFTKSWINPEFNLDFIDINFSRQAGRAMMFDSSPQEIHMDERIINFLKCRTVDLLDGFDPNTMEFRVHIVTGIAGQTGSAGVVELAHFVHRAFDNIGVKLRVYGYLYLPDVVEQYHVGRVSMPKIRANGYAALKELDYYQSAFQRESEDELYLSIPGTEPYTISRHHRLYNMVYLVSGSNGDGKVNKNRNAIETVSAFIVGQLPKKHWNWIDSILANLGTARKGKLGTIYTWTTQEEKPNECGEDSFGYNAIGVATAAIPKQTIKMYAVSKLLKTVLGKEDGFKLNIPFVGLGIDHLTPAETEPLVNQILPLTPYKVETKIRSLVDEVIQWRGNPEFFLTRNVILDHSEHDTCRACLRQWKPYEECKYILIEKINQWIDAEYATTLDNIVVFLKQKGLKVFIDLYDGVTADGLRYDSLHSLVIRSLSSVINEYRSINISSSSIEETVRNLNSVEERIAAPSGMFFFRKYQQEWLNAFRNNEIESFVSEIAKMHVFGEHGVYWSRYLAKISALAEEIKTFYFSLEQLSSAYESMGKRFESYEDFLNAVYEESVTNVNVIASEPDYNWAKQIVDRRAANIAFTAVRDRIIDSFMEDPKQWTEFDPARPEVTPRRVMDQIVADQVRYDDELNVITLIQHKLDNGIPIDTICEELVASLSVKAEPLLKIQPKYMSQTRGLEYKILVVPNALICSGETGYNLKKCIESACLSCNIMPYFCNEVKDIECYSIAAAIPLYSLADLETWEAAYENTAYRTFIHSNESDTGIYNPETGLRWIDYPSLCLKQDPRLPDSQGKVSREGEFFKNVIDPMFADAISKGVITKDTVDAGGTKKYSYSCYLMDNPSWDYSINFDEYEAGEDGLYPMDDRLYSYFAKKNHGTLDNVKKSIRLLEQGNFSEPYPNRKIAMDRAKRALRRNVPLFIALKKTLAKWDDVTKVIREANAVVLQEQVGTLVPYYLASGLLSQPTKNRWMLSDYPAFGKQTETEIVRMDPFAMIGNKLFDKGLKYLVIWNAFMQKLSADPQIQTMWRGPFSNLVDNPASYADEFLARLRPFYEEAEDFVTKYDGTEAFNNEARQVLCTDLDLDGGMLDELVDRYHRVIEVYNQITDYKE